MEQFWIYFKLGFFHILTWSPYDHLLFLTVLVAAYTIHEWKRILWLVTLFALGHTFALMLAVHDILSIDGEWVGFLVPITILITACYVIFTGGKKIQKEKLNLLAFTSIFFGVVHGLGFSAYFGTFPHGSENEFLSITAFGLGIEVAQIVVALLVLILGFLFQSVLHFSKRDWILVIASLIVGLTLPILSENWLW